MLKKCSSCKELKETANFSKNKSKFDGLGTECKTCRAIYRKTSQHLSYQKRWDLENKDKRKTISSRWRKNNPKVATNRTARYNATKINATPSWLTEEQKNQLKQIYINCPDGHEVDHIIPLRGKEVRGLHVPWNLQYLTPEQNSSKNNKLDWKAA